MIGLHNLSIRRSLVERLELVVTIFWLLYFMDVKVPPPLPASIINSLSYPFIAILLVLHWRQIFYVATRNIPLLIFVSVALFSLVWSADFNSTLNINRGLVRTFIFGGYFATRYSLKEQMKILAWVIGIAAVLSLMVCIAIPSYGIGEDGWQGIFSYKNFMGRSMVLGAVLFLILTFDKNRKSWLSWTQFSFVILLSLLSQSSTSIMLLILLLAQMPLYGLVKQQYRLRVILLSLVSILFGIVIMLIVANQELILVDVLGEGTTFNGRTPIWSLLIDTVSKSRPWLGYGYGAFWTSDGGVHVILNTWASDLIIPESFNAHSVYLEIFANLGMLGVILYGIVYLTNFFQATILLLSSRKVEIFWLFQLLLFETLASLADVGLGISATNFYGVISMSACMSISLEYQRLVKKQQLEKAK